MSFCLLVQISVGPLQIWYYFIIRVLGSTLMCENGLELFEAGLFVVGLWLEIL